MDIRELEVNLHKRKARPQIAESLAARKVLGDCERAHKLLETCPEDDTELRRVFYVAVMALLRAVGHVLHKVDGAKDTVAAQVIKDQFTAFRTVPIFSEFIEKERNNVLKSYSFAAEEIMVGGLFATQDAEPMEDTFYLCDFLLIEQGHFEGADVRDVALEGIEFWKEILSRIEASLASHKHGSATASKTSS